ncbi:hypothetical protein P4O66_003577 [Electrophorus voltai]|uniref:Uncharacterized protein n=1 Tax=Electrophorus voltai TaxID=2609070 RepID=A0AAD8ZWJ4_9TELE|nr:hypothetical protein P4O66_003577 [Electrophorus voltai]
MPSSKAGLKGEFDELFLMVQQEMMQTLDQQHDTMIPCQLPPGRLCSHGDDPDKKREEVSEGLSLEDFPALPCTALPCGDRPAQKAHIKKEVSSNIPLSAFNSQAFDNLAGLRPQRNQRQQKCQRLKCMVFSNEAIMEAIQSTQASKALNEPCSQLPVSCQPGDVTETAVDDEKMSKKQGRSNLLVFAGTGEKLMIENLPITGGHGLQRGSTDGARVVHDPAGADTKSTKKAAGLPENSKSHCFQEDATVRRRKVLSSASDKVHGYHEEKQFNVTFNMLIYPVV